MNQSDVKTIVWVAIGIIGLFATSLAAMFVTGTLGRL